MPRMNWSARPLTALLTGQDAPESLSRQREVHVAALRQLTADLRDAKTVGSEIAIHLFGAPRRRAALVG